MTHIMKPLTAHAHCMSSFQRLGVFEHRVFDQQCVTASLSQAVQVLFAYCTKEFVKCIEMMTDHGDLDFSLVIREFH